MKKDWVMRFVFSKFVTILILSIFFTAENCSAAQVHFIPSVSVSEEYTDNYNQTEDNTEDEFNTEYLLGLYFEYIENRGEFNFSYNLSYLDYRDHDESDSWEHDLDMNGILNLTRHTDLIFSESFARSRDISQRTGLWEDHDYNEVTIGLTNRFGQRNSIGADCSYFFNKYDDPNIDEYESLRPSVFLNYWIGTDYGFEISGFYEKTEFDVSRNEQDTWSGTVRFLRQLTNHFQAYAEYEHSISEDDFEKHTVYNPSIGFEWMVSETSTVSVGVGVLMNRYDNQEDSEDLFVDIDAFKLFNLSRRGTFAVSVSSGYGEISDGAASLGFRTYYRAGCDYNYDLTRESTLNISASYWRDEFDEETVDRVDHTLDLSIGIVWNPIQWLSLGLSYSNIHFNTDTDLRDDYIENIGIFTVTITNPWSSQVVQREDTREMIESRLFDR